MAVSGNQVKADLDVLRGVAGKLVSDYEQLQSAITTLQGEASMHAASWSGEAKNAWTVAMEGVNSSWTAMNSLLDEIAHNINVSGTQYNSADSSNAAALNRVPTTGITTALNH